MPTYFKPLRRKIGVMTLVLACLFTVGWVRSRFRYEFIFIPAGSVAYGVCSMHGGIDFIRRTALEQTADVTSIEYYSIELDDHPNDPFNGTPWSPEDQIEWRWDWGGFHVGDARSQNQRRHQDYMMPYWAIVIPLTALSAYLLLSKPNQRKTSIE